jgi:hypothetical protein
MTCRSEIFSFETLVEKGNRMPWNTPTTWNTSQLVTAADLNAQVRDNVSYVHNGKPAVVVAKNNAGSPLSTSLSTWQVVHNDFIANVTTTTGRVLIAFAGSMYADANGRLLGLDVELDGVRIGGTGGLIKEALVTTATNISFTILRTGLSNGSHTLKLMWSVALGTAYLFADSGVSAHFSVAEW